MGVDDEEVQTGAPETAGTSTKTQDVEEKEEGVDGGAGGVGDEEENAADGDGEGSDGKTSVAKDQDATEAEADGADGEGPAIESFVEMVVGKEKGGTKEGGDGGGDDGGDGDEEVADNVVDKSGIEIEEGGEDDEVVEGGEKDDSENKDDGEDKENSSKSKSAAKKKTKTKDDGDVDGDDTTSDEERDARLSTPSAPLAQYLESLDVDELRDLVTRRTNVVLDLREQVDKYRTQVAGLRRQLAAARARARKCADCGRRVTVKAAKSPKRVTRSNKAGAGAAASKEDKNADGTTPKRKVGRPRKRKAGDGDAEATTPGSGGEEGVDLEGGAAVTAKDGAAAMTGTPGTPKKRRTWKKSRHAVPFADPETDGATPKTERMAEYERKLDKIWNERFDELEEFRSKHGHTYVPQRYAENTKLGKFVENLRKKYKKHLNGERVSLLFVRNMDRLKGIGFDFEYGKRDTWEDRLAEMAAYREEHGDCMVPNNYKPNPQLANWVATQRRNYKNLKEGGSAPVLTAERIAQLDELGFKWHVRGDHKTRWDSQYEDLKAYKQRHGNCVVPTSYEPNPSLHSWVLTQRVHYRNACNNRAGQQQLSADRIAKLQLLGFEWDVAQESREVTWEARFRELITYKATNGHCRVPKVFKENIKLGNWVYEQRKNYRHMNEGKSRKGLTEERIRRLEEIGFEWSVLSKKIEERQERQRQQQEAQEEAAQERQRAAAAQRHDQEAMEQQVQQQVAAQQQAQQQVAQVQAQQQAQAQAQAHQEAQEHAAAVAAAAAAMVSEHEQQQVVQQPMPVPALPPQLQQVQAAAAQEAAVAAGAAAAAANVGVGGHPLAGGLAHLHQHAGHLQQMQQQLQQQSMEERYYNQYNM